MTSDIYTPRNPIDLYPAPPFKPQQQSGTGEAPEMDPKPDHGEESYVGHGRLAGRKALVTGADSGIGRAVAIAFAREGADVALSYLDEEQPEGDSTASYVEKAGQKAVLLPGDLSDAEELGAVTFEHLERNEQQLVATCARTFVIGVRHSVLWKHKMRWTQR